MTSGDAAPAEVLLLSRAEDVAAIAARAARAAAVAVDVEANGLFAYRPRLCTVQLAFREGDRDVVVIVDALATPAQPLAALLGPAGPVKVLHDLTFDARLLDEVGAPLGNARDTSVAARFLGFAATGLAALLAAELDVRHDKALQQHDWGQRPIAPAELQYLAADVRHLIELDARLAERAAALGIEEEIAEECAHKLKAALRPPRDGRPAYTRIQGATALDPAGRAILRRLALAREEAAEVADVPPFKVAGNDVLLALARRRPMTIEGVREVRGAAAGRASRAAAAWLRAIEEGLRDGDVPEEDQELFAQPRPDRVEIARRRSKEAQIAAWRRGEAKARGVDEQVILPGHCAQELVEIALALGCSSPEDPALLEAIGRIAGLGAGRHARYGAALAALAALSAASSDSGAAPVDAVRAGRHRERRVR